MLVYHISCNFQCPVFSIVAQTTFRYNLISVSESSLRLPQPFCLDFPTLTFVKPVVWQVSCWCSSNAGVVNTTMCHLLFQQMCQQVESMARAKLV